MAWAPLPEGKKYVCGEENPCYSLAGEQQGVFQRCGRPIGKNKGRLHHVVMVVCQLITQRRADVIRWPSTEQQLQSYASKFQQRSCRGH